MRCGSGRVSLEPQWSCTIFLHQSKSFSTEFKDGLWKIRSSNGNSCYSGRTHSKNRQPKNHRYSIRFSPFKHRTPSTSDKSPMHSAMTLVLIIRLIVTNHRKATAFLSICEFTDRSVP